MSETTTSFSPFDWPGATYGPRKTDSTTAAVTKITEDGDVLDLMVWKHYRSRASRIVERVLDANPGLCEYGPVLPAGLSVLLPAEPVKPKKAKMLTEFWTKNITVVT